jgi:hypothetical protein
MTIDEYDKLPPEEKEHFTLVRDSHEITGGEWLIRVATLQLENPGKRSTNAQFHS